MAWSKKPWNGWNKWGRRRSTKAGIIPASRIPRSIARTRSEWVTIYNPMGECTTVHAPWPTGETCNILRMEFSAITADQLTFDYGDDVKVVAAVGSFAMRPVYARPDRCNLDQLVSWRTGVLDSVIYLRGGLYKQPTTQDDPAGLFPNLAEDDDWSDTRLQKRFAKKWFPRPTSLINTNWPSNSFQGVHSGTARAAYNVPATSSGSQPLYNVPAITSTCAECFTGSEDCYQGFVQEYCEDKPWKSVVVNMRKTIRLRENDKLSYVFAVSTLRNQGQCGLTTPYDPCGMQVIPELKLRIQYG